MAWAIIDFNGSSFGVCSIYAPNEVKDQIILWNLLCNLSNIPWILAGDFNMVENQEDKLGGLPFAWKHQEKIYWDQCKHKLNLFDPLEGQRNVTPGLWFTWCNFKQGHNRIYSRLYRFYVNSDFFSFSPNHQKSPVFASSSTLSDHLPIIALINIRNALPPSTHHNDKFILNTSLLNDQDTIIAVKMVRMFNLVNNFSSHVDRWNRNVSSWRVIFQNLGQRKAKNYRRVENDLNARLQSAELDAQANPTSIPIVKRVSDIRDSLRRHQHVKTIGAAIRGRQQWLKFGDKGSKFFFNYLKLKQSKEKIDRIVIDNQELNDINDIVAAFENFYKNLFRSEDSSIAKELRNKCKVLIPNKFFENDVATLRARISL